MLNALVDLLGALFDRAMLLLQDHWPALLVIGAAIFAGKRFRLPASPQLRSVAATRSAYTIVFFLSLACSVGARALHGLPLPSAHDDFAYLLSGEIFARGRTSFPTPALWQHFESLHVLQLPRYAGKYQPGPSAILALGTALFRTPIAGVWLCIACACVAVLWMLRAFVEAEWALLGAVLFAIHPTVFDWSHVYHGGGVAAAGGALVVGGARRLAIAPSVLSGAALGLGGFALAASRPFEGLVLFSMAIIALANSLTRAALLPVGVAVVVGLCGMALLLAYNRSITGSALRMPYSEYESQYDPVPNFIWQPLGPIPHYRSREFTWFYDIVCVGHFRRLRQPGGIMTECAKKIDVMQRALIPRSGAFVLILYLPLLALPSLSRDATMRAVIVALLIFAVATLLIVWWMQTHYLAPAAGLATLAFVALLRAGAGLPRGPLFVCAVLIVFCTAAALNWIAYARPAEVGPEVVRQRITARLMNTGGMHLIIVPQKVFDYVHNGCDINRQTVVWARSLSPAEDAQLFSYFQTRSVWLLDAENPERLIRLRTVR